MPTLYTLSGTCALAPNIAIAWLDAPIDVKNMARGDQKKPAYLEINPAGAVPALQFDDGDVLTQAAAILAYIGATYGADRYARDRTLGRKEAEALSYMTSEVHAAYGPHFAPQRFAQNESAQVEVRHAAYDSLKVHYARIDAQVARNDGWYLGERSFADAYAYVLARWIELTPLSIDDYGALKQHRGRMEADDGVKLALRRQEMDAIEGSSPAN